MVDCRESKARYRYDHLHVFRHKTETKFPMFAFMQGEPDAARKKVGKVKGTSPDEFEELPLSAVIAELGRVIGPDAGTPGTLTEPRQFNLMFQTNVGAVQSEDSKAYLRPETAQGIFLNFKNVLDTMRVKVPFGIAQIGKAFRNEVTPRNFIFRSREFEQMEMEWFCHPEEAKQWHDFWCNERARWWRVHRADQRQPEAAPARKGRARALRQRGRRHLRHRVPLPVHARPTSASSKASRTASTTTCASIKTTRA